MNRTIAWNPGEVPLNGGWDVVVAGGGPAGCAAGAAAARAGARVLVIEKTGALGGMGTMGLVPAWCPFSDGIRLVYQGIAEKVLRATMAGMPHLNPEQVNWTPIDPERLKRSTTTSSSAPARRCASTPSSAASRRTASGTSLSSTRRASAESRHSRPRCLSTAPATPISRPGPAPHLKRAAPKENSRPPPIASCSPTSIRTATAMSRRAACSIRR